MKTYIQITAGRGPIECARVVWKVFNILAKKYPNIEIVDLEYHTGTDNCLRSIVLALDIPDIEELRLEWEGSIKWIATNNPYRPNHKRKNWFIGIKFFNPSETVEIKKSDIKFETLRSSGPGGQNVNKVETAVRAIYVPTGLTVKCDSRRTQLENKKLAEERLRLKLTALDDERENKERKIMWDSHTSLERGNPIKTIKGCLD